MNCEGARTQILANLCSAARLMYYVLLFTPSMCETPINALQREAANLTQINFMIFIHFRMTIYRRPTPDTSQSRMNSCHELVCLADNTRAPFETLRGFSAFDESHFTIRTYGRRRRHLIVMQHVDNFRKNHRQAPMTRSLRRSRRAPKRNSDYNVGDIVQVHRSSGVILEGRLAQFLSEASSPNPRWLVKFDGQSQKDEEMYERAFGKILVPADDEDDIADAGSIAGKRGSKPSSGGSNKGSGSSSDDGSRTDSKTASDIVEQLNEASDASSNAEESTRGGKSSRVSAREARSKRRQAKIDDVPTLSEVEAGKGRLPIVPIHPKKRHRGDSEGEVVKVKLLTGTLYLHRGRHRRAEFVRRV
eukprot:scaffold5276_cov134-Cylindrotheca_fusiformis.AAC.6